MGTWVPETHHHYDADWVPVGYNPERGKKLPSEVRIRVWGQDRNFVSTSTINILPGICPLGQHAFARAFPTLTP